MSKIDRFIRSNLILAGLTLSGLVYSLYLVFIYAPREREMGEIQRIFYFHVASAWLAMFAFLIVFVGSIAFLWKSDQKFDRLASASAEIGVLFTTLVLLTGPLWAKSYWSRWWTWDPRLTSSLVLWIIYLAYLILRANLPDSRKKYQFAAVYAIVAFLDVPIVFFSIRWWRSMHPVLITAKGMNLEPEMVLTLAVSCVVFTLLYILLLQMRLQVDRLEKEIDRLHHDVMERRH